MSKKKINIKSGGDLRIGDEIEGSTVERKEERFEEVDINAESKGNAAIGDKIINSKTGSSKVLLGLALIVGLPAIIYSVVSFWKPTVEEVSVEKTIIIDSVDSVSQDTAKILINF